MAQGERISIDFGSAEGPMREPFHRHDELPPSSEEAALVDGLLNTVKTAKATQGLMQHQEFAIDDMHYVDDVTSVPATDGPLRVIDHHCEGSDIDLSTKKVVEGAVQ